ncbi:MAG: hypothetical protein ABI833_06820 [Acidobacteriota bacterium]
MFIRKFQTMLLLAGMMGGTLLFAHDEKLHAGKATPGEIVSISENAVVMKTASGNVSVVLSKDTKYEMGEQAVDLKHFKKGDKISVIGTKLATGELAAKEVMMTMAPGKPVTHSEGEHKH